MIAIPAKNIFSLRFGFIVFQNYTKQLKKDIKKQDWKNPAC